MFQVNDLVMYGTHGICKVNAIGSLAMSAAQEDRLYYTLKPLYEEQHSAVYTPVDNKKAAIRPAVTKEEALELIDQIPDIETIWVVDDRQREGKYKEIMQRNEGTGWMQIIKTLYLKKQKRLAEGKKSTAKDDFYFNMAQELLYGELAAALLMDRTKVKGLVEEQVSQEDSPVTSVDIKS